MKKSKNSNRSFGLTVGIGLLVIFIYQYLLHHQFYQWLLIAALVLILTGTVAPRILSPLLQVWTQIGRLLGTVNSFIILFIIYFFVLTPIATCMRWAGKDLLATRKKKPSYWKELPPEQQTDMQLQY